jgi:hypothetical protein
MVCAQPEAAMSGDVDYAGGPIPTGYKQWFCAVCGAG